MKVVITGKDLTLEQVVAVARNNAEVALSQEAKDNVLRSRKVVDDIIAEKKVVYGVTTGFGSFCNTVIKTDRKSVV